MASGVRCTPRFGPMRPGVVPRMKTSAPLWGAAPLRGGSKSSLGTLTVFEVFRYLVDRTFSSQVLRHGLRKPADTPCSVGPSSRFFGPGALRQCLGGRSARVDPMAPPASARAIYRRAGAPSTIRSPETRTAATFPEARRRPPSSRLDQTPANSDSRPPARA